MLDVRKLLATLAVCSLLAACSDSDDTATLDTETAARVAQAESTITQFCLAELEAGASLDSYDQARTSVDQLIAIYRDQPGATYQPGGEGKQRTMRQVLSDRAARLDECNADMARDIDRALDAEPANRNTPATTAQACRRANRRCRPQNAAVRRQRRRVNPRATPPAQDLRLVCANAPPCGEGGVNLYEGQRVHALLSPLTTPRNSGVGRTAVWGRRYLAVEPLRPAGRREAARFSGSLPTAQGAILAACCSSGARFDGFATGSRRLCARRCAGTATPGVFGGS